MKKSIVVIEENVRPFISHVYVEYLKLPDRELKVLLALKSFAWNHKDNCYPSVANIGKIIGKSGRQVTEILHELQKKELIRIETTDGFSNIYYITNKPLSNENTEKLSTPVRKSGAHPCGNPHPSPEEILSPPPEEILSRSNIRRNNKKKQRACAQKKPAPKKPAHKKRAPLSGNVKKSYCPGVSELIISHEACELAKKKKIDIEKAASSFMAYAKSIGWLKSDWKAAFMKWLIDEKSAMQLPVLQESTQGRSCVPEWGPGHPSWEAMNGIH